MMDSTPAKPIATRPLGNTGIEVPMLGLGTAEGGKGLADRRAVRLFRHALDRGITYFDTAPGYGSAHRQLRKTLRGVRDSVILAGKAPTSDGKTCRDTFERTLREIGTDRLDIGFIHSLGNQDIDRVFGPGGSFETLLELKQRGLLRFIGFSAHNRADSAVHALESVGDRIDVIMLAMNAVETHTYGFERKVLPLAKERGIGVIAMKTYGGAPEMKYERPVPSALYARERGDHEQAFRYVLSLPGVASTVIGVYSEDEIDANIEYARRFRPLTADELAAHVSAGREAAPRWGERYGPA